MALKRLSSYLRILAIILINVGLDLIWSNKRTCSSVGARTLEYDGRCTQSKVFRNEYFSLCNQNGAYVLANGGYVHIQNQSTGKRIDCDNPESRYKDGRIGSTTWFYKGESLPSNSFSTFATPMSVHENIQLKNYPTGSCHIISYNNGIYGKDNFMAIDHENGHCFKENGQYILMNCTVLSRYNDYNIIIKIIGPELSEISNALSDGNDMVENVDNLYHTKNELVFKEELELIFKSPQFYEILLVIIYTIWRRKQKHDNQLKDTKEKSLGILVILNSQTNHICPNIWAIPILVEFNPNYFGSWGYIISEFVSIVLCYILFLILTITSFYMTHINKEHREKKFKYA
ncbi:hypothetical protein PPL_05913 [Heterostelium album PN500]|uniref:Uncharacterized protein n=1 Tax=Heterostelium pallidum (strain ATCC 26659 / Pp 5 / PN500) TaxID=670386 RepID=D3BBP4_HETP5|nr:hypothetical protein PPL_05913 [Heterostelium album PN500]EFA81077.1 hypothetical protein PPL_05913 [Heterostelium album PN500]|eukprot:XP_020433195.1 hypothetical protein PPL_05913 [Heterostelium album PN500]